LRIATTVSERTGFFFGWWVVFASAVIIFLTGGTFFYGFTALFNPLVNEFGWSRAAIAFAFSLRAEVGGVAAPLVGFLVDRLGSRILMVIGVILVSIGFVLLSQVQTLLAFYGAIVVIAIGMSAAGGPVGMVAIAHWFRKRRGTAMAMMTVGAGSSGVMVLVLAGLISLLGWRGALLTMAGVQFVVCLPLAMSIRNRPSDLGLQPDGDAPPPVVEGAPPPAPEGLTVREAVRSSDFWKLAAAVAFTNVGMMAVIVHQIPFLTTEIGLSEGFAATAMAVMTVMSLGGRYGMGRLADSVDKRYVMAAAFGFCGLSLLAFASVFQGWQVVYALPLFAFGWGGSIPIRPALQAEYFGLRAFGAIQGIVFTVAMIGALVGPVFAGWMFDQTESYRLAFVILSLGCLISAPLVLTIKRRVPEA
jgi:MFS family permease